MTTTPATEALAASGLDHDVIVTQPASSAEESAALQGIALSNLLKSLVVRRGEDDYVFVLVPGDRQIDWRKLRQHLNVSRVSLPDRDEAERVTGYEPGTITPFGSSARWPTIVDSAAAGLEKVALGGGARGVNVHIDSSTLVEFLDAEVADVTSPLKT